MTESTKIGKEELRANIDAGWNDLQNYLMTLTFEQVVAPSDPAGWTPKDHLAHLAIWEDSLNALLEGEPRWQHMDVPHDLFAQEDWDAVNTIIQQRYHDIGLRDLQQMFFGIHERLLGKLQALSEDDLRRPYNEYQPGTPYDLPISHWFVIETYEHYDEHKDYIDVIVKGSEDPTLSKDDLLAMMERGWNSLNTFLSDYSDEQLTIPTDAAGWSAKDHLAHLARWEDGIWALLDKQSRVEQMGVPADVWERHDIDEINGTMRELDKDLTLEQVRQRLRDVHERLVAKIETLSDEDLQRPYQFYDADVDDDRPVIGWISGNTYDHYAEHKPWIRTLIAEGEKARLIAAMQNGWNELNAYLGSLDETQITEPTDAAGWTVKDHVIHLAMWEGSMNAFFDKQSRGEYMGVSPQTWAAHNQGERVIDRVNDEIYQAHKALPWAEVQATFQREHDKLLERVKALSIDDLQRPYIDYQPDSTATDTALHRLGVATHEHYAEHIPWMQAIVEEK